MVQTRSQQPVVQEYRPPCTAWRVLLYYPNLIGYLRIAFVLASCYVANDHWQLSTIFYVLAFAGDVVDGAVARKFNQCERQLPRIHSEHALLGPSSSIIGPHNTSCCLNANLSLYACLCTFRLEQRQSSEQCWTW